MVYARFTRPSNRPRCVTEISRGEQCHQHLLDTLRIWQFYTRSILQCLEVVLVLVLIFLLKDGHFYYTSLVITEVLDEDEGQSARVVVTNDRGNTTYTLEYVDIDGKTFPI